MSALMMEYQALLDEEEIKWSLSKGKAIQEGKTKTSFPYLCQKKMLNLNKSFSLASRILKLKLSIISACFLQLNF